MAAPPTRSPPGTSDHTCVSADDARHGMPSEPTWLRSPPVASPNRGPAPARAARTSSPPPWPCAPAAHALVPAASEDLDRAASPEPHCRRADLADAARRTRRSGPAVPPRPHRGGHRSAATCVSRSWASRSRRPRSRGCSRPIATAAERPGGLQAFLRTQAKAMSGTGRRPSRAASGSKAPPAWPRARSEPRTAAQEEDCVIEIERCGGRPGRAEPARVHRPPWARPQCRPSTPPSSASPCDHAPHRPAARRPALAPHRARRSPYRYPRAGRRRHTGQQPPRGPPFPSTSLRATWVPCS